MPEWKTRDPRNKFKGFLEHLDSNYYDEKRRKITHLRKTFYPYVEKLIKDFEKEGIVERKKGVVNITFKGYKYLDYLRNLKMKDKSYEVNRANILGNIVLAISILGGLMGGFQLQKNRLVGWIIWISTLVIIFYLLRHYSKSKNL